MSEIPVDAPPSHTLLDRSGISIKVDEKGLVGYLSYEPTKAVPEINPPLIKAALKKAGVVFGIDEEAINKLVSVSESISNIVIARGKNPVGGDEPSLKYQFPTEPYSASKSGAQNTKMDFRERDKLPFVKAGDVVATIVHKSAPSPGRSITGEELPPDLVEIAELQPGNNVKVEHHNYVATVDGGPRLDKEGRVEIQSEWIVDGDVDIRTGNIYFPGPVKIHGVIQSGFEVHAASIHTKGIENRTYVETSNYLEVDGGILGGRVVCGGNLDARFINNAEVICHENVLVKISIVNSDIRTSGYLETQTIFGGSIAAKAGVTCLNLSSENNRSIVIFGVDPIHQKNISEIVRQKLEVEELLSQIREKVGPIIDDYDRMKKLQEDVEIYVTERDALTQRREATDSSESAALEFLDARLEELIKLISPIAQEIEELMKKTADINSTYMNEMMEIKRLNLQLMDLDAKQPEMEVEEHTDGSVPKLIVKGKALTGTRISSSHARILLKNNQQRVVFAQRKVTDQEKKARRGTEYYLSIERL